MPSQGFSAQVTGRVAQGPLAGGLVGVNIVLTVAGQNLSRLAINLQGPPISGGGIQMTSSSVSLGTGSDPTLYRGTVTALQGTNITASIRDSSGHLLNLTASLQIDPSTGAASGSVQATP